jgi:hypothetical protein
MLQKEQTATTVKHHIIVTSLNGLNDSKIDKVII